MQQAAAPDCRPVMTTKVLANGTRRRENQLVALCGHKRESHAVETQDIVLFEENHQTERRHGQEHHSVL